MRPGPLAPRLLLALALLGLAVPAAPAVAWVLAAGLAFVLGAAGVEAGRLWRLEVVAERRPSVALSLGEAESLELSLRTSSPRAVHLLVRQAWPRLLDAASTTRRAACRAGETVRLALPVRPVARGRADLAPPWVAATFWGLAERVLPAAPPGEVVVLPDLRAVGGLHAKLNRFALRGLGSRTSPRLGKGREFDRLREYVRGDEFRDIAWRATARHRKLIVREHRLDRSQDVVVCLDRGHRMAARVAGLARLDHAVNAAVLLGYICNRMEDRVGLVSFATDVTVGVGPGRGAAHLRRLTSALAGVRAGFVHTDYRALAADLRRRRRARTLVVLLTALPELETQALVEAARSLLPQHLPLVVVLDDPALRAEAEARPRGRAELARALVARDVASAREQTVRDLRRLGALVVETAPGDAGVAAMNAYIDVKRRQLL
jgi:uncharacterized protein (DUF58 family)